MTGSNTQKIEILFEDVDDRSSLVGREVGVSVRNQGRYIDGVICEIDKRGGVKFVTVGFRERGCIAYSVLDPRNTRQINDTHLVTEAAGGGRLDRNCSVYAAYDAALRLAGR